MEATQVNRKLAIFGIITTALLLASPVAMAQKQQYGSTSGDERVRVDGAKCFEATAEMADTTCVVLYGHFFDLLNKVPINTQRPPDGAHDLSGGFSSTPGYERYFNFNELILESSPGFVEYPDDVNEDPRLHPERGLSADVEIAPDVDILGYWYLSADFDEFTTFGVDTVPPNTGAENDPSVGAMPCLTVRMKVQTGRVLGVGDVIAEGKKTMTIITGKGVEADTSAIPSHTCPEGESEVFAGRVAEIEVNLGKASQFIPQDKGFIVHVEWWTHNPNSDPDKQEKVYQHTWNLHSGPDYVSRVVVPVKNPVFVEKVRPQFFDGKLYVQGVLNSPWGSYDVDVSEIELDIIDADGNIVKTLTDPPSVRFSVDHDGHFKPVNATFIWDYEADGVALGEYELNMRAKNWQWTGEASRSASIVLEADKSKNTAIDSDNNVKQGDPTIIEEGEESPGVTVTALLLVAFALVGLGRIRRR